MDSIPLQLQAEFETLLRNRSVPAGEHPQYKKWLRFYLDFCRKYRFSEAERKSLEHFLRKLQEKKQTEKTLKTYKTWVRHIRTFTKSPDPKSLSADDVKAFRTFLAVTKKVSASTQNQAFNALERKYPHAATKFVLAMVFPGHELDAGAGNKGIPALPSA